MKHASAPEQTTPDGRGPGPARAVGVILLGALLVALLAALNLYSHLRYDRYLAASALPSSAVFLFVAVLLGNALWRRAAPRRALSARELLLLFAMLYISAALPQASVGELLVSLVAAPSYHPPGNPHFAQFGEGAARWLQVQDPEAIRLFYQGQPAYRIPWAAWAVPLAAWSLFSLLLLFALYCLSRVFTHRWVREERVAFPLMEIPLELLNYQGRAVPVWRSRRFYLGAAVPTALIVMQQLRTHFPFLPDWQPLMILKVGEGIVPAFPALPWSALNGFAVSYSSIVVGVGYLLSGEVAASIWLFHLLFWAQLVAWAALGYPWQAGATGTRAFNPLDWVYGTEFGAAIALAALLFWSVRGDAGRAARALVRGGESPVPPWALAGFVLANVGMLLWGAAAGMQLFPAAVFLFFLYAIVIVLGRLVAAGGLILIDNDFSPQPMYYGLAGTGGVAPATHFVLTGQEAVFGRADMSFFYYAINDSKLACETRTDDRWHGLAIAVSVVVALVLAYFLIVSWGYRYGAVNFRAWPFHGRVTGVYDRMAGFMHLADAGLNPWTYVSAGAGIAIGLFLAFVNRNFLWWSLSPFGFVVASSWNIANYVWSSIFLGWLAAAILRRYGGLALYRRARPFFLGLIIGEAVVFSLAALVEIGLRGIG